MPRRRLPDMIMSYLGECRPAVTPVEKVMEQCSLAKFMADWGLTDFDPLVVVMTLMTEEVVGLGFGLRTKKGRKTWLDSMSALQDGDAYLEHNERIPCRWCDKAFIPVIDDELFDSFVRWYESRSTRDLLAIHTCPECGGTIVAQSMRVYHGDMHTPEPHSIEDDAQWAETLLQHSRVG